MYSKNNNNTSIVPQKLFQRCFNTIGQSVDYFVAPDCLVPQSTTSHLEDRKVIVLVVVGGYHPV